MYSASDTGLFSDLYLPLNSWRFILRVSFRLCQSHPTCVFPSVSSPKPCRQISCLYYMLQAPPNFLSTRRINVCHHMHASVCQWLKIWGNFSSVTFHMQIGVQKVNIRDDSKRWTQFRRCIFPELYMICERSTWHLKEEVPLERSPSAQLCSSVSWEQNGYYVAQEFLRSWVH